MKTLIMVQHTEAEHHLNGHIGAWQDWALTERGRGQAFRIGEWLKRETGGESFVLFVSPQLRARQTAEEICKTLGLETHVRDALREVNAGAGNGKTRAWYRAHEAPRGPGFDPDYRPFPDAESDRELWQRLEPFLNEILESEAENILVVSHGTTLSFLQSMLAGQSVADRGHFRFNGSSGSVSRFSISENGRVTASYVNQCVL